MEAIKRPPAEINFNASAKQAKAWRYLTDNKTNFVGYGGAAFGGKSYLLCYWLVSMASAYPGTGWGLGRKELVNLKKTTLKTLFKVFAESNFLKGREYRYNQQLNYIEFWNGSEIFLIDTAYKPSDPLYQRFGGYELTGCAIDESAETAEKAIEILFTRIGRRLNNDYGLTPKMLETFNPNKNHVYRRYFVPYKLGELPPAYQFVPALPRDNPSPETEAYIAGILENSDRETIERLIYGNFEYDDDPSRLMEYDEITDIFGNIHVKGGKRCISVDAARFGSDRAVIGVWNGWRLVAVKTYAKSSITDLFEAVEGYRNKYKIGRSSVVVDGDGVGGGLIDMGKYREFTNIAAARKVKGEKKAYGSLADQCSFYAANQVNKGELYVEPGVMTDQEQRELIEEMEVIKRDNTDKDGPLRIIKKEVIKKLIKRSPDLWDMVQMRADFDIGRTGSRVTGAA